VSFCTGSFTLAAAGVLDGRQATTHWRWAELFATRHPAVRLRPDVLFVDDNDILTAAGSAAALDLCLHLIRRDHGAETANAVSRRLVFAAHRDGGQRQFVERPVPDIPDTSLAPVLAWALDRLDQPLSIAELAAHAADDPDDQIITVKCEPDHARAQERGYASITPGRYLDKRHWISLGPGPGITERLITDAVEDSYGLVAERLPRRDRPGTR